MDCTVPNLENWQLLRPEIIVLLLKYRGEGWVERHVLTTSTQGRVSSTGGGREERENILLFRKGEKVLTISFIHSYIYISIYTF